MSDTALVGNGGTQSVAAVALMLLAVGIGTGVLVLPRAMAAVGFLPMIAALVFGSIVSALGTAVLFLAAAKAQNEEHGDHYQKLVTEKSGPSYAELLDMTSPSWAGVTLNVMMLIYNLGCMATYFIFLSGFLHRLEFWPSILGQEVTIAIMACLVFLASTCPSIGGLAKLASAPLIALVLMSCAIWIRVPQAAEHRTASFSAVADLQSLPAVTCICIFAFNWSNAAVSASRELRNPTPKRCAAVAFGGASLLCLVYTLIALGGYLSFGGAVLDVQGIVDMYSNRDPLLVLIRIALSVAILINSALQVYPTRESIADLVRKFKPEYTMDSLQHNVWGFVIMASIAVTAVVYPDAVRIITLLGGCIGTFMMIIFPTLIARVLLRKSVWIMMLVFNLSLSAFLLLAGLGVLGKDA